MDATISQLATQLIAKVADIIDPDTALDTKDILYLSQSLEVLARLTEPTGTPASVPTHAPVQEVCRRRSQVASPEGLVKIGSYQYQVEVFPDKVDFHRITKGVVVMVETVNKKTGICNCKYGKRDCSHKKWLEVNPQAVATVLSGRHPDGEVENVVPEIEAFTEDQLSDITEDESQSALKAMFLEEVRRLPNDDAPITDEQINDITESSGGVTIVTEEVTPELMEEYLEDINGMPPTPVKTDSITAMIVGEVQSGTHPVAGGLAGYLPGSTGEDDVIEVESVEVTVEVTETEPDETSDNEDIQMMTFDNFMALKRVKPLFGQRLAVTRGNSTGFYIIERKTLSVGVVTEEMAQYSWQVIGDLKQMVSSHLDELDESIPVTEPDESPVVDTDKTHPDPVWDTDSDDEPELTENKDVEECLSAPTHTFEQVVRTTLEGRVSRMGIPNPEEYTTQELAQIIKGIIGIPAIADVCRLPEDVDEVPLLSADLLATPSDAPLATPSADLLAVELVPDADPFGGLDF